VSPGPAPDLNAAVQLWRQGDCIPGANEFMFRMDPKLPTTPESQEAVRTDPEAAYVVHPVEGFMVVTQTCDLVKPIEAAPFAEVSPLVTLAPAVFREVQLGARPRFVTVPTLHSACQAADLDRTLTIEKACLALWPRQSGCRTDLERRRLSLHLGRKRQRAALPDGFAPWFKPLRNRLARLARSGSPDAKVFLELEEIRVQPAPSWDAAAVSVFIWFLLKDEAPPADRSEVLREWLAKLVPMPPIVSVDARLIHYADLQASDYRDSDPLDLDHFSPDDAED